VFLERECIERRGGSRIYTKKLRFSLSGAMSPWLCCVLGTHAVLHYLNFSIHDIFPTEHLNDLSLNAKVGIHALYTRFRSSSKRCEHCLHANLSVKVSRISTSHTLLSLGRRLLLLRRLVSLIRLVTTLGRCRRLLLLRRRRSAVFGHLWLLWRVDACRTLQRHLLHLGAQVWPLLLLLLRGLRRVRIVPTNGSRHS
jgi:hypothetical protein